jgi:hypothetical protein
MKVPRLVIEEFLKPAIDDLQLTCMTLHYDYGCSSNGLDRLAKARKELISTIRKSLVEAGATPEFLGKFDKAFPAD